jgi:hypothetical protein
MAGNIKLLNLVSIYFFTLNFNNSLNIETKIYINECLQVEVFIKGEELTPQVIYVICYEEFFLLD